MASGPAAQLRKRCLALPEAHEVEAWGEPTYRIRNKIFAMQAAADRHGGGRHAVWVKAPPGMQELMVRADPDRYFVPPYVGKSGWIGIRLDAEVDWEDVERFLRDSYRLIAPKRLVRQLDESPEE